MFRSRHAVLWTLSAALLVTAACLAGVAFFGAYHSFDFALTDRFHRAQVSSGAGPVDSGRIAYLTLTDETYAGLASNTPDRAWLARVNRALDRAGARAIAYDIIFSRPARDPHEDAAFARSLSDVGRVYLPLGFALCAGECALQNAGETGPNLLPDQPAPLVHGPGRFFFARRGIYQIDAFARAAAGLGHVNAPLDDDRVMRHFALVIRAGERYLPALPLALFLDELGIDMGALEIRPGRWLRIPARPERGLENDLTIPIDERGRVYVPFAGVWNHDFPQMRADRLLVHAADPGLSGNLSDFFDDRFVFVGDVSSGVSDTADTPLERRAPLVAVHAHVLNALLTGEFYRRWSPARIGAALVLGAVLLAFSALLRRAWPFYLTLLLLGVALYGQARLGFARFELVPAATIFACYLAVFVGALSALRIALSRERTGGLQRLNDELFQLKDHLEELVSERTRELKTTLKQIETDLETARQVQQKILPDHNLELTGCEYHYEYLPLDRVGGDLIDLTEIRPGVIRIFLADAVGHGVQASLLTMAVNSEYQELKADFDRPHELMLEYNARLIAKYNMRLFTYIPCFLADLHVHTGELFHASCGMPDQLCLPPAGGPTGEPWGEPVGEPWGEPVGEPWGEPIILEHSGPAIGFMPEPRIATVQNDFPPGSTLLLFSDGLPETHNAAGEMLGEDAVREIARAAAARSPARMIGEILGQADRFRRGYRVMDDLTILAVRRISDPQERL